jgi:hypothetical protein
VAATVVLLGSAPAASAQARKPSVDDLRPTYATSADVA